MAEPGFWNTPFSASEAVAATREFSELQAAESGVFWLEYDPASATQRLWRWQQGQEDFPGRPEVLSPAEQNVRSRVNEYGGGSFCVGDSTAFFVDEQDQQIYRQHLTDWTATRLTHYPSCRFGDLVYDHAGQRILCVREDHAAEEAGADQISQDLVAVDCTDGEILSLARGADFYASPQANIDGSSIAWVEWSVEHMPWESTRLAVMRLKSEGRLSGPRTDSGELEPIHYLEPPDSGTQSLLQPRFDAEDRLWCLSDHQGWWQLYFIDNGVWRCFDDEPADQALPPSQLGHQQYAFLPGERVALTKLKQGWMQLEIRSQESGTVRRLLPDNALFRHLHSHHGRLYCITGAPGQATAVVQIDPETGQRQTLAGGERPLPETDTARPLSFTYPVGEADHAHGFFYSPRNSREPGSDSSQAPVVVMTHGGPTSATYAVFSPMIQYWTQRGFAVADLNYRGSSGFGRAYRQSLHLRWGLTDVEDVLAALDELTRRRWCDTQRAFIRGSSAGGFTTLSVVASSPRFLAGCSLYGVSDPWALRQATHRFESRYLDWLIADGNRPDLFHARSPLANASRIRTPMIFFQGGRDRVVVPSQTESMVAALQAEGLQVTYHYYPEEGHGFRQPENRRHALEEELGFYRRRLRPAEAQPDRATNDFPPVPQQ